MTFEELVEMAKAGNLEVSSLPLKTGMYYCDTEKHEEKDIPATQLMFFVTFSDDAKDVVIHEFWVACQECHDVVLGDDENVR